MKDGTSRAKKALPSLSETVLSSSETCMRGYLRLGAALVGRRKSVASSENEIYRPCNQDRKCQCKTHPSLNLQAIRPRQASLYNPSGCRFKEMLYRGSSAATRALLGVFAICAFAFVSHTGQRDIDDLKELHAAGHEACATRLAWLDAVLCPSFLPPAHAELFSCPLRRVHKALDPVVDPVINTLKALDDSHAALAPETTAHEVFEENKDEVAEAIADIPGEIADAVHEVEEAVEDFEEEAHEGFEPEESAHDVAVEIEENVEEAIPDIAAPEDRPQENLDELSPLTRA